MKRLIISLSLILGGCCTIAQVDMLKSQEPGTIQKMVKQKAEAAHSKAKK